MEGKKAVTDGIANLISSLLVVVQCGQKTSLPTSKYGISACMFLRGLRDCLQTHLFQWKSQSLNF